MPVTQSIPSTTMSDLAVAADLMAIADTESTLWAKVCSESLQPELRGFFQGSLNRRLNSQAQLLRLNEDKGWSHVGFEPTEQLKDDMKFVTALQRS